MTEVDISREAVERQLSANIGTNGLAAKICRALLAEVEGLHKELGSQKLGNVICNAELQDVYDERDQLRARVAELEADRRDADPYLLKLSEMLRGLGCHPAAINLTAGQLHAIAARVASIAASKEGKTP